jgi:hypothetical protein
MKELVRAYLDRYARHGHFERDLIDGKHDVNAWVLDEFYRLIREDADTAWAAILAVLEATDDVYTLVALASGPLRGFIDAQGERFIERIAFRALVDAKFRHVLGAVWPGSTRSVWQRVIRARRADGPFDPAG